MTRALLILCCGLALLVLGASSTRATDAYLKELVSTGRLRVALQVTNPVLVTSGNERRGLGPDLGRRLADRLRVAFQPVAYTTVPELLSALQSDAWDVTFLTIDSDRARLVDFTPPYMEVNNALLAPPLSPLVSSLAIDTPRTRVAVIEGSSNALLLARTLTAATLVRVTGTETALEALRNNRVDVLAENRPLSLQLAHEVPGARLLDHRYSVSAYAMAVPKGRGSALRYVAEFLQRETASGAITYVIDRNGIGDSATSR
jgi:polar amino acid transport system substrate-binding protein